MIKKIIFLTLLFFIFTPLSAYAVSPTETASFSGTLSAISSNGYSLFILDGSSSSITGSDGATGNISYDSATNSFSGSINLGNNLGTLTGTGNDISSSNGDISYSNGSFSGSISLNSTVTETTDAVCSNGTTITSGQTCSSGSPSCSSGYTLNSNNQCVAQIPVSLMLSGSGGNITVSGGNSSGKLSMIIAETCPSGYIMSNGSCISAVDAGTSSTFVCTSNGTAYQDCDSGSILPTGSAELCPISQTQCTQQTSTPQCPSGYAWNGTTCTETTTSTTSPTVTTSGGGFSGSISFCEPDSTITFSASENTVLTSSQYCGNGTISFDPSSGTFSGSISICTPGGVVYFEGINNTITSTGNYCSGGTIYYNPSTETFSGGIQFCVSSNNPPNYAASGDTVMTANQFCSKGSITYTPPTITNSCPSGYTYSNGTCTETVTQTSSPTCPSGTTLINGECVSYSCPLNGAPQGSAPGQNYTCVEPSGSSTYYCSPYLCYNDTTNTPVSTPETMPAPQTNNGKVTSSGCSGSIYIFPGQALQCTRDFVLGENCCSRGKFLLGGRSCSSNSQILAEAIIYDNQYSPPVPVYSGAGDPNTAPITSCSPSSIATGCGQQGEAIYLGDYCSLKLPIVGTCLANTYVFCKFQGLLAAIIQAQGRAQLAGGPDAVSWGSVNSPNCTGFTPAQFQELNFSNMNLSEYVNVMKQQTSATISSGALSKQIQDTTTSVTNEVKQIEGSTTP